MAIFNSFLYVYQKVKPNKANENNHQQPDERPDERPELLIPNIASDGLPRNGVIKSWLEKSTIVYREIMEHRKQHGNVGLDTIFSVINIHG